MAAVKVFMSYRRADNPFLAGRLKDELGRVFGDQNVFYDVDSIRAGVDFREVIRETLQSVDAVIALIGSDWDAPRLAASNDPLRAELREALEKQKLLIPVLVGDTVMPQPEQLPAELQTLAFLNAVRVRPDPDFENDAANLVREIVSGVSGEAAPMAAGPADPARRGSLGWFTGKRIAFVAAGIVAAIVLAVALGTLDNSNNNTSNGNGNTDTDAGAAGTSNTATSAPTTRTAQVVVDGATAWTDTGFDVAIGERVDIRATGMVFHNPQSSIGPDGVRGVAELQGPLGSDHHAGLIGRISDNGAPFLVGETADFSAEANGRLFLGINDVDLTTNSGSFDATVTISAG